MRDEIRQRVMNYLEPVRTNESSGHGGEIEQLMISKHVLDGVPVPSKER